MWINGHRIGATRGAFVRGTFDISPYLAAKGGNVIAVKVSPPPHPGIAHEESIAKFGADPRNYAVISKEFAANGNGGVGSVRINRIEWQLANGQPPGRITGSGMWFK